MRVTYQVPGAPGGSLSVLLTAGCRTKVYQEERDREEKKKTSGLSGTQKKFEYAKIKFSLGL